MLRHSWKIASRTMQKEPIMKGAHSASMIHGLQQAWQAAAAQEHIDFAACLSSQHDVIRSVKPLTSWCSSLCGAAGELD